MTAIGVLRVGVVCHLDNKDEIKSAGAALVHTDSLLKALSQRFELPSSREVLAGLKAMIVTTKTTVLKWIDCLKGGWVSPANGWVADAAQDQLDGASTCQNSPPKVWERRGVNRNVSKLGGFNWLRSMTAEGFNRYMSCGRDLREPCRALLQIEKYGDESLKARAKILLDSPIEGMTLRLLGGDEMDVVRCWQAKVKREGGQERAAAALGALAEKVHDLRSEERFERGVLPPRIKELMDDIRPGAKNPLLGFIKDCDDVLISDEVIEGLQMRIKDGVLKLAEIEGQLKTRGDLEHVRKVLGLTEPLVG